MSIKYFPIPFIKFRPKSQVLYTRYYSEYGELVNNPFSDCEPPKNRDHNGKISKKARSRLSDAVEWFLIKEKIHNFITLTLPSEQIHSDKEIKKKCLNQFLTELRQKHKVSSYIWKSEIQSNGNIHFHILVNAYIYYKDLQSIWNRIINKLGYVDRYKNKMYGISFEDYYKMRKQSCKQVDIKKIRKAYKQAVADNWSKPNSSDIHKVDKIKDIAAYIAKYMTKEDNYNYLLPQYRDRNGRLWFIDRYISQLAKNTFTEVTNDIKDELNKVKDKIFNPEDQSTFAILQLSFKEIELSSLETLKKIVEEIKKAFITKGFVNSVELNC